MWVCVVSTVVSAVVMAFLIGFGVKLAIYSLIAPSISLVVGAIVFVCKFYIGKGKGETAAARHDEVLRNIHCRDASWERFRETVTRNFSALFKLQRQVLDTVQRFSLAIL